MLSRFNDPPPPHPPAPRHPNIHPKYHRIVGGGRRAANGRYGRQHQQFHRADCRLITLFTRGTSRPLNLDEPEEAYTIDIFFSRFACNLKPWIQDHIFFCLSDVAMGQKRPRCRQLRLRPEDIEIGSPRRTKLGTHCL